MMLSRFPTLIRSNDGGKTWTKLGLEGEADFHLLATSFATDAVYVFNHGANSRLKSRGLHYTLNGGMIWTKAAGRRLTGEPLSHPQGPKHEGAARRPAKLAAPSPRTGADVDSRVGIDWGVDRLMRNDRVSAPTSAIRA